MALQPYEIANFNLMEFASIYNDFIDTNNEKEMSVQYMDKDGNLYNINLKNVASITKTIKGDIEAEAALREKNDAELNHKITEVNTSLSTKIAEEIQNRIASDKKLSETIDTKYSEVSTKVSKIQTDLVNEIDRATKAETEINTELSNKIQNEISERIKADKELDTKFINLLNIESEAREKFDTKLSNKIDEVLSTLDKKIQTETSNRIKSDEDVLKNAKIYTENLVNDEANKRELSDGNLDFNDDIRDENGKAKDLTTAINIVDNRLVQEIKKVETIEVNLQNSDKKLQSEIDEVSKKIEAILAGSSTDLDSFKELVDYINKIDAEDDQALAKFMKDTLANFGVVFRGVGFDENGYVAPEQTHYINDATSLYSADKELDNALYVVSNNIEAEVNRAKSAEAKLQENIDNETQRATKAEGNLEFNKDLQSDNLTAAINEVDSKLIQEIQDRIDADTQEKQERQKADGNLNFDDSIVDENGKKADDLTEAINDVNKKVDKLYSMFHLNNENKENKKDDKNDKKDDKEESKLNLDFLKQKISSIFEQN